MPKESPESTAVVHCAAFSAVTWLSGAAWSRHDAPAVFRFRLADGDGLSAHLRSVLQPDELARAGRYRREYDQRRFTYARGLLRRIAGAYTNQAPASVRFVVGANRKPELADAADWQFNVSHSGDWILIVFGKAPVGIDVEQVNPDMALDDLLPFSFSPDEQAHVAAQADTRRSFYHLWTRKEALAKATAKGIDDDFYRLPSLDGVHRPPAHLIGQGGHWAVRSFAVADAYLAAVAYQVTATVDHASVDSIRTPSFYTLDAQLVIVGA